MIELRHVSKINDYGRLTLRDINVTINKGDSISIIGPSGTGKSTLLRCINMLNPPTSGQIFFNGEEITAKGYDLTKVHKKIGMVFQNFNLFPHLTVVENIMKPQMDLLDRSKQEAYDKAMYLLNMVGLKEKALRYPDKLSGGQQQRVAICRTLAMDPEIILFDEPTSALDPTMVGEVEEVIKGLKNIKTTMVIVTHEMRFAREVANRVFYIDEHSIYEEGSPYDIFENPHRPKTKRFIRQYKTFETSEKELKEDMLNVFSKLKSFGNRNDISSKRINEVISVIEELCYTVLYLRNPDIRMNIVVEYDDKRDKVMMKILYDGDEFDPKDGDKVSMAIVRHAISRMTYRPIGDNDTYTNSIHLTVR